MTTTTIQLTKLTAADGMVLTDGTSYGKEVYLGVNDTPERWSEIPEGEIPEIEEDSIEISN
ncbi:MAG: hypothetical protein ACI3XJ_12740 [Oscillospiraceae bacterium]